jgi:hypothetical protein
MLFGNQGLYEQTRKIRIGEAELPPILYELKEWANNRFGINVISVFYDRIESGPHKERPRVTLIMKTHSDYSKMYKESFIPNESYQQAISERFAEIVEDARLEEEYDTDDILVVYDDFSDVAMIRVSRQFLENHKNHLMSEFSDLRVWNIVQSDFSVRIVVFYHNDNDITENDKNGNSERIKRECFRLIKQYDEFDYCQFDTFPITFDSKQNLNKNYRGNLYYYFK